MPSEPQPPADIPRQQSVSAPAGAGVSRPIGVYVITVVVALQALAIGAIGVISTISAFTTPMVSAASGVFFIVLLFALAAGLAAVSRNAFKGMRWTRSAAFVWQLLMVAIGIPALLEGNLLLGAVMVLPAVATAYYLFTPRVVEFSQRSSADAPVL